MKKQSAVFLAVFLLSVTVFTNTATAQYNNLKPMKYEDMQSHWGAYSAGMLATRGYVIGEEYGNCFYFRPDEAITRYDFVLMVNAIFGVTPKDSLNNNPFSDKNVPSYIMRTAIAAYEEGLVSGSKTKNGTLVFRPYDAITRAEAITTIHQGLKLSSYGVDDVAFRDKTRIPAWAMEAAKNLEAYGIVQGYEDNTLRPYEFITRAQAAELIWQSLKFLDLKQQTGQVFETVIYGD